MMTRPIEIRFKVSPEVHEILTRKKGQRTWKEFFLSFEVARMIHLFRPEGECNMCLVAHKMLGSIHDRKRRELFVLELAMTEGAL